jgi:hypothetical protein
LNKSFFYFLKKQPTLILRDIITSIEVMNKEDNLNKSITIYFIPTSPLEILFYNKPLKYLSEIFHKKNNKNIDDYYLNVNNFQLCVKVIRIHRIKTFIFILKSVVASLISFLKFYILYFNVKLFLYSRFKKIQYGDIACSVIFRNNNIYDLKRNIQLIKEVFRLTLLTQIIFNIGVKFKVNNNLNYFSVLDFTYSEALLLRILPSFNFKYIETQDYKYENLIIDHLDLYYYPFIARNVSNKLDHEKFNNYYKARLYNPHIVLDYMWMGINNNNSSTVVLDNGTTFVEKPNEQYVVLFLHAFSDAAFCYGLDGFKDLMDWTTTTINTLLTNNNIYKILIKPHPNISFDYYPSDQKAMIFLRSHFFNNEKILFLEKDCSLIALCNIKKIIGITRHGSVAEEMTYLNKPVIAYKFGPWRNYHNFLITWDNEINYTKILLNIDFNQIVNHPIENKLFLINYCFEYRMNSRNVSKGWYDVLFKYKYDNEFIGNFENIKKLDSIIVDKNIYFVLKYLFKNNAINLN